MVELTLFELVSRILVSILFGGIVGYDREVKGQSAGFRTHMLVSVGATMFALIQIKTTNQIVDIAASQSDLFQIFSIDQTRLIAQIISGIGFLGAGAIIVTKRSISGLTTAASIWATAAIGIAIGMGYYEIAIAGTISIVTVLTVIKNKLGLSVGENLVVHYIEENFQKELIKYFEQNNIQYYSAEFRIERDSKTQEVVYSEHYVLKIPKGYSVNQIVQKLGKYESVTYVSSQPHIV